MRLDLADRVALEPAHARHAVRLRAPLELAQALDLGLVDGDDELAALHVREVVLGAVGAEESDPTPAELGFQRSRRVVDPGVDDAAVTAGLVQSDVLLLLQDGDRGVGSHLPQPACHGETEDPPAHDADALGRHSAAVVHGDGLRPRVEPERVERLFLER